MKITCIDAKNRPNEIPNHKWLEEGKEYTPTGLLKCNSQGGIVGLILAEIDLDESCAPYKCFHPRRFAIPVKNKVLEEELETVMI